MLSNEFLILREKKKNLDTQIANLKSDPNPSNKKEHRRKLDELEEKLEKVRNKLRKVKNQLKSVS